MKLIGITQRVDTVEKYGEQRDALDQRWSDFLTQCGFTAIIFPNHLNQATDLLYQLNLSGMILSGGKSTAERDQVEALLIKHAYQHKLPLLGVCHGMQQIQRHAGITLKKIEGHVTESQPILINSIERYVNSYHEYGTAESTAELAVWAKAHDGVVKAIKHLSLPIMGIMWHPERTQPFSPLDIQLFKQLFGNLI